MNDIKNLGLVFANPDIVEEYYHKLKGIFLTSVQDPKLGFILDISALPTSPLDIKSAVIKWLISVNLDRIKGHQEPIVDLQLVLKCPVWKIVKPPLRRLVLTPEKLFNSHSRAGNINKGPKVKGINKR
jgi:hypothetical protein